MGKNYKWVMLALLSGAFFFHQADRAIFGLLTIPIQQELGLSDVQIGWINTVLSWTLAGMALVAEKQGDCPQRVRFSQVTSACPLGDSRVEKIAPRQRAMPIAFLRGNMVYFTRSSNRKRKGKGTCRSTDAIS